MNGCIHTVVVAWVLGAAVLVAENRAGGDSVECVVSVPMLVCHEMSGGVHPPQADGRKREHDLVFFVIAGRSGDGTEICEVNPRGGEYLKFSNERETAIVKGVTVWKGKLKDDQGATLLLAVREQEGSDSSQSDLKAAAHLVKSVDNSKGLRQIAKTQVDETLAGEKGENDHIGTIAIRIRNERGRFVLETEPGADARYLKGFAKNHPSERSFELTGNHSRYDLHLRLEKD